MLDNWHRIERIIKWTGMSINAFAKHIGLNRAENLYQIRRGKNGISPALADTIIAKYPQISKGWLLSGEGSMFISETNRAPSEIPFYAIEAVKYAMQAEYTTPTFHLTMPTFRGVSFAAICMGDSMMPEIPPGAVGLFSKVAIDQIIPGKTYLIISESFKGIRYIRTEIDTDMIRLVPANKEKYDEIRVKPSTISKIYLLTGLIIDHRI